MCFSCEAILIRHASGESEKFTPATLTRVYLLSSVEKLPYFNNFQDPQWNRGQKTPNCGVH